MPTTGNATSRAIPHTLSFDGLRMHCVQTAPNGVIGSETIFVFTQADGVVEAHYAGGAICTGRLIGRVVEDRLEFRYAQLATSGELDGGHSVCDIERCDDGRLRLVEHFQWASRDGGGANVIEEIRSHVH